MITFLVCLVLILLFIVILGIIAGIWLFKTTSGFKNGLKDGPFTLQKMHGEVFRT